MKIPNDWTFKNKDIAEGFDSHVKEQLPWYEMALELTQHLALSYLQNESVLIDLACSTGAVTRGLSASLKARNVTCLSIDNSSEMINSFNGYGDVLNGDITENNTIIKFNVSVCFLGVMFTQPEKRYQLIDNLMDKCHLGGAIIIVDKIEGYNGYLGTVIGRMSIKNKISSGVSHEDILKKELSLNGIQRPTNESLYIKKGFIKWFQVGEFAGFIYEKKNG